MFTFKEIVSEDADMILRWRMTNRVTKFMNTDIIYDLDAQNKWLSSSNRLLKYLPQMSTA